MQLPLQIGLRPHRQLVSCAVAVDAGTRRRIEGEVYRIGIDVKTHRQGQAV